MSGKKFIFWLAFSLTGLVVLTACTQAALDDETTPTTDRQEAVTATEGLTSTAKPVTPNPLPETVATEDDITAKPTLLAGTNIAKHSVPLEDVVFDTFNGSYVPLSDITEATTLQLRDAIPPIGTPKYTDVETANAWLTPDDLMIGYVDGDKALAYPARILNYHEFIDETVNGVPILISYCPLCNSGVIFDRRLGDRVLEFGNTSALYQSNAVMYDKQTFSYWFQISGDAIVGDLTGQRLEALPTRVMRWSEWRETYPQSQVLSRDTGFDRPYDRDPFTNLAEYLNRGNFPFPVGEDARNPALPAGEQVVGLVINDEARAYPIAALRGLVANDELGGRPVAVAVNEAGTDWVLSRQVDEQTLTFAWDEDMLIDEETSTRWSPQTGEAISGPLAGEQLEVLPERFTFWFAFVAAFPEVTVYQPE